MKKTILLGIAIVAVAIGFSSCEKENVVPGKEEVLVSSDIITPTIWLASKIYVVEYDISVNANLTIEPGTVIKFKTGASLKIGWSQNATITANGTADNRILFTSYASTPTAGAWEGMFFYSNTQANSSISYCDFEYAGTLENEAVGIYCRLHFNNNTVRYAKSIGISLNWEGSFATMSGNAINNCGTHAIAITPGAIHTIGTNNTILCASGYGIYVESGDLTSSNTTSATWKKQTVPYIFNGLVNVLTNLNIEAGTTLKFEAYGYMRFGFSATTTINAIGTVTDPIIFTSSNATPAAGAWYGVEVFHNTNSTSRFEYCQFKFAGKGSDEYRAALYVYQMSGLTVKNCSFSNSGGYGIFLDQCSLSASSTGNTFSSCALGNIGGNNP